MGYLSQPLPLGTTGVSSLRETPGPLVTYPTQGEGSCGLFKHQLLSLLTSRAVGQNGLWR